MQNNIFFFQSPLIGSTVNNSGLFELLLTHLDSIELKLFEQLQIIVPSLAMASWLKDQIAVKRGICANLDCVVLPGPVLDNIYYANNPQSQPFNFSQAKYIIYDYLCHNKIGDADELNSYIYFNDKLDKLRSYQLASQLQKIFHEYIYLRTEDLLNLDKSAIKSWQKKIIIHLFKQIGNQTTFLDVYKYFMTTPLDQIQLPANLMIFGLTSIYPSQLQLLGRLSNKLNLYWYYQTSSYQYYGDLLSDKAKSKLEQKLLKKPDLNLEDLYLQDGNVLLANFASQSREFTELLIANDIDIYVFDHNRINTANTILQQIQEDVRNMIYRIEPDYRFGGNLDIYADPIDLADKMLKDAIYDLPNSQSSLKINVCHNRMREVQVMFNEIAGILNNDPKIKLSDILITAPDIDDYSSYIAAVFDNETIGDEKLLYNVTGNRQYKNYKILETLKILLNAPYVLTVNYFIQILIQSEIQNNFQIGIADVELVKKWLHDNNIHFGYDESDYASLGYVGYQVHSFRQFLNNIVLGACISENIYQDNIPLYSVDYGLSSSYRTRHTYIPYDNLDNNQVQLCNKLIILINQLEMLRTKFYSDADNYSELTISQVHTVLTNLNSTCLKDKNSISSFEHFLGGLLELPKDLVITLPILNLMLDEYIDDFKSSFMFNGNITCASMRYMRNIPYKIIYILGLNFGEYPHTYIPNQLSLLAHEWYLADRNYNIEDKQTFLDIILACNERLYLSYIGRTETDNSEIKPSPLLGLFINTLGQSFSNFAISFINYDTNSIAEVKYDFKNLLVQQSLHPFYNNSQPNYSRLWFQIGSTQADLMDKSWDFTQVSPLSIDLTQFYQPEIVDIVKVFLYSNINLYRVLGISWFDHELELSDTENINLTDRSLARQVLKYFKKYQVNELHGESSNNNTEQLQDFLIASGILSYDHIGHMQFNYYYELYNKYMAIQGKVKARLILNYNITENIQLMVDDEIYLEDSTVIVTDSFVNIFTDALAGTVDDLPYSLKIRGLIVYLLCFGGAVISVEGEVLVIEQVLIRQINTAGESRDFILHIENTPSILNRVLRYYVRSLSNPVLIHKKAIQEYVKLAKANKPHNLCIDGAKAAYVSDFENYDLDKIREDTIFSSIAENYFEFIQNINTVNDIVKIGEILSQLGYTSSIK